MAVHPGLFLALHSLWSGPFLDFGPYSAYTVLNVALLTRATRALTLRAVPWFAAAVDDFVRGGRRPALVDRFGIPTPAGRRAGVRWPSPSSRSGSS